MVQNLADLCALSDKRDQAHLSTTLRAQQREHFVESGDQHELNHAIAKIETGGAVMSDDALEVEKKKRLKLKDEIVQMLNKA